MSVTTDKPAGAAEIRPFQVDIPDEALDDLRRRIQATRLPEKETVADTTQGVQLATMEALARYWGTEYDFGRVQARSSPRSTAWTSTSSTSSRLTRMRCR
jgi:hypothetical protein